MTGSSLVGLRKRSLCGGRLRHAPQARPPGTPPKYALKHALNRSMAKLAISLCGEGRGHATRISTLVERLDRDHEIVVYTSADALAFLR